MEKAFNQNTSQNPKEERSSPNGVRMLTPEELKDLKDHFRKADAIGRELSRLHPIEPLKV